MKSNTLTGFGLFVILALMAAPGASADESMVAALQDQVNSLSKTVAMLQKQVAAVESKPSSTYIAPAGEESGGGLFHTPMDIEVGGYVDVQYNNNATDGTGNVAAANAGRIFDRNQDSFSVNAFELNFEKAANPEGGAGFRVDLAYGEDSVVVNADGDGDRVNLQQAYVEYVQPLGFWSDSDILPDSINLKAGRFATLAGLEVIEGPDNWNISRSFAFGLTIPFIHTGVRSNFQLFNDKLDVYLGVNNGWDQPIDVNKGKTLEAAIGYSPLENVSLFHAVYWGAETAATEGHKSYVFTNVITWDATDKLSFMGEINAGGMRRVATLGENATWLSFNGYARYQFTDKFAISLREELFRDPDLVRGALDTTLIGHTVTGEYALTDNLIARAELRVDKADNMSVLGGDSTQTTFGGQLLYLIG